MTVKTARTSHGTIRAKSLNFFWNGENGTDTARYDYGKYFECFYRNYGRDTEVRASSRHGHGENSKSFHSNHGTDVKKVPILTNLNTISSMLGSDNILIL